VAAVAGEEGGGGSDPATPRLIDAMADDEVGRAAEEEERGKGKCAAWKRGRELAVAGEGAQGGRRRKKRGEGEHTAWRERGENERLRDSGSGRARGR
jgi:hypothetical protein